MTSDELEYMAKCAHRSACERLVTLHAPLDDNSFWWCRCKTCPNYSVELRSFNIAMLEASVEYLRKENIDWEDTYRELAGRYARLNDLALMLHGCALGMADCDMCRRSNDGYACEYIMRELGVIE